jgi:hypothetical protein
VSPKDKKPTEKPPVCAKHHVEMRRTESDRGARVWRCYQYERETQVIDRLGGIVATVMMSEFGQMVVEGTRIKRFERRADALMPRAFVRRLTCSPLGAFLRRRARGPLLSFHVKGRTTGSRQTRSQAT